MFKEQNLDSQPMTDETLLARCLLEQKAIEKLNQHRMKCWV